MDIRIGIGWIDHGLAGWLNGADSWIAGAMFTRRPVPGKTNPRH